MIFALVNSSFAIKPGCYNPGVGDSDYSIFIDGQFRIRKMRQVIGEFSGFGIDLMIGRNWTECLNNSNITNISEFINYFSQYNITNIDDNTILNNTEIELYRKMKQLVKEYYKLTCGTSFNGRNMSPIDRLYQYVHDTLLAYTYKHSLHIVLIGIAHGEDMADFFAAICYYFDHQSLWDQLVIGDITKWNITISALEINSNFINAVEYIFQNGYKSYYRYNKNDASYYDDYNVFMRFTDYYLGKYYNKTDYINLKTPQWSNFFRIYDDEQYENQQLLINCDGCYASNVFGEIMFQKFHIQKLLKWINDNISCGAMMAWSLQDILYRHTGYPDIFNWDIETVDVDDNDQIDVDDTDKH